MESNPPAAPLPNPSSKNPLTGFLKLFKSLVSNLPLLAAKIGKAGSALMGKLEKSEVVREGREGFSGVVDKVPLFQGIRAFFVGLFQTLDKIWTPLAALLPAGVRTFLERHRRKIWTAIVFLVVFSALKNHFFHGGHGKIPLTEVISEKQAPKDLPIPVKGFKVGRFNFEDSLNALGTIKGAMEFKLSFEVPGVVSSINYHEGERYEEGALLISLRQDDILLRLKRAQAEMNKAQTQSQIAEQKVKENEKLFAMGAVPKSTLENAKLELESTKYETEAARLEVKANESMLEKSNLYAPSAGMIGELNVEEGETVSPNTLLGTHIMTEYVYAEFGVVERDVNKLALGQKSRVFVDAYPDKSFDGVIENVAPVVTGTSRTATVRVRIENPERLLLPGMFARIRILLYSKKNTLVLPTDSIQGKEGEKFVYAIHLDKPAGESQPPAKAEKEVTPEEAKAGKVIPQLRAGKKAQGQKEKTSGAAAVSQPPEQGVVEKRPITIGYTRPDYSQIDAGISEGEVVAVSGLEKLEDGKKVRLLETQEAEM